MFGNYLITAWRHIAKNKLYAVINILGLVVGLSVYVFSSLLATYENSHDLFFKHADRIFTVGSLLSATADIGINEIDGVHTGVAPFIESDIPEIEAVARTIRREFLISIDEDDYYQSILFADAPLLEIFDLEYIEGDSRALEDPLGLVLSRTVAEKLFGDDAALGKSVILDHDTALHVTAVIQDLPPNTHFNSSITVSGKFEVIAPLAALKAAADYDLAGNFTSLNLGDMTYMLLPPGRSLPWLQSKLDGLYDSHFPDEPRELITGFYVRPLKEANTIFWDAVGLPALEIIQLLGILVLVVAIVNYTNLATAQSLGRAREVGLRKTLGAGQRQLLVQFLVESLTIATISMLIALACLEIVVPVFNTALDRALSIDYAVTLPWLVLTTIIVGLVAGAYPAHVITQSSPIEALRDGGSRGTTVSLFRSTMLGLQFTISIFMLAMVLVVFLQNVQIENSSHIFPKSQILTLQRLQVEGIQERLETLRNEIKLLPGVTNVAYSSQVPFQQNNNAANVGPDEGDETQYFLLHYVVIDFDFMQTYDIPLLAGRNLSLDVSGDTLHAEQTEVNVIINKLAASRLGFTSAAEALNKNFYDFSTDRARRVYTIVGIMPDQNFLGLHNKIKPMLFMVQPKYFSEGSIRIKGADMRTTVQQIEAVWDEVIPEYPIQIQFLDETFNEVFDIYSAMTKVLSGFAFMALTLSMIGLFGLAAFMAARRTKEIGIRKVMGASLFQIVRMLIWQFSKPVMWALLVALPVSYFASNTYLDFFADRLQLTEGIVLGSGIIAVAFAWAIVAIHAVRIARSSPITALRYE
jgi:putative ABC transport system permease protein